MCGVGGWGVALVYLQHLGSLGALQAQDAAFVMHRHLHLLPACLHTSMVAINKLLSINNVMVMMMLAVVDSV